MSIGREIVEQERNAGFAPECELSLGKKRNEIPSVGTRIDKYPRPNCHVVSRQVVIETMMDKVMMELARAKKVWPEWPEHPLHALAILSEEVGELTQAMLQMIYEPHRLGDNKIEKEAVQVAAMALRLLDGLPSYVYAKSGMNKDE